MSQLLDRVREAIRTRHYSIRTEESYIRWIREYIFFADFMNKGFAKKSPACPKTA